MKNEHILDSQIRAAQLDSQAADELIAQYLPFIRSETMKSVGRFPGDGDDELSIAMFAFYEALMAYQPGKGAFLKLAAMAIRSRLIDNHRKEQRHAGQTSLDAPCYDDDEVTLGERTAVARNDMEAMEDREAAQWEIREFSEQLQHFGLTLSDIAENCPKQDRTLKACMQVLAHARENLELLEQLVRTRKLPLAQLAAGAGVEKKTLERHRKYVVAILLAYTNGFEIIRDHLRMVGRKEETRR